MNIFVLTGAGVSAESGLGTFRDREGLWARFDPMKLATPEAFARTPNEVHEFYNMRRRNLLEAQPNDATWRWRISKRAWRCEETRCSCAPKTSTICTNVPDRGTSSTC